jgi:hypothetical protein
MVWLPLALMGASAAANAIRGVAQNRKAKGLEADFKAKDAALTPVSPDQYAHLAATRRLERSMRMGGDPSSQFAKYGLGGALAQTQDNLVRAGNGQGTVNALLRGQQGYNQGMAQVGAQAGQQANEILQYQGGLIDNIQRSIYGLQMKRRNYAQALMAQQQQAATDSMTAAIGSFAQAATMIPNATKDYAVPGGQAPMSEAGQAPQWMPRQGAQAPWYATPPQQATQVGNYMEDQQTAFQAPEAISYP